MLTTSYYLMEIQGHNLAQYQLQFFMQHYVDMFHSYKVLIITISFTALSLGDLRQPKDAMDKNEWLFGFQDSKCFYIFLH